jgi:hypothetical protein
MYRLESKIKTSSPEYPENYAHNQAKLVEFRERLARIKRGGPPKAVEKHKSRGKLTARGRTTPISPSTSLVCSGGRRIGPVGNRKTL